MSYGKTHTRAQLWLMVKLVNPITWSLRHGTLLQNLYALSPACLVFLFFFLIRALLDAGFWWEWELA